MNDLDLAGVIVFGAFGIWGLFILYLIIGLFLKDPDERVF